MSLIWAFVVALLIISCACLIWLWHREKSRIKVLQGRQEEELAGVRAEARKVVGSLVAGFAQLMDANSLARGFIMAGTDAEIAHCNAASARLLGWPPAWAEQAPDPGILIEALNQHFPDMCSGRELMPVNQEETEVWLEVNRVWLGSLLMVSIHDISAVVAARQQELHAVRHDIQTGVFNHQTLLVNLDELFKEKERLGNACMVLIEMNTPKDINNRHGFSVGNAYIRQLGELIQRAFQRNAIFSRHANNEFFGFIYGYPDEASLKQAMDRLWEDISALFIETESSERIALTVTGGLSWYPRDGESARELMDYATFAAYFDKKAGQSGLISFNRESYRRNGYLLNGREAFAALLAQRQVRYAFQPIVDVTKARLYGYEMLMRPQSTVIRSPGDVINLARVQSKLHVVENLTWFEGMRTFADAVGKGLIPYDSKVFINSIGGAVLSEPELDRFYETFFDHLKNMVVEITETDQDDDHTIGVKRRMVKQWKAQIAIDDYGSGYNSELSLLYFQPDIVKVDMAIIQGIDHDPDRQVLLKNLIRYARQRQSRVLAEGIESKEELKMVIECGVDYVQGYYLGRPDFIPRDLTSRQVFEIGEFRHGRKEEVLSR